MSVAAKLKQRDEHSRSQARKEAFQYRGKAEAEAEAEAEGHLASDVSVLRDGDSERLRQQQVSFTL